MKKRQSKKSSEIREGAGEGKAAIVSHKCGDAHAKPCNRLHLKCDSSTYQQLTSHNINHNFFGEFLTKQSCDLVT